mgnify:CR=1 FL=1
MKGYRKIFIVSNNKNTYSIIIPECENYGELKKILSSSYRYVYEVNL